MPAVKVGGPRVSFAELQQLPDDGRRYELYAGVRSVVPAPVPRHQIVVDNLRTVLRGYSARHGGIGLASPIDIVFSQYDVIQPDVVFFVEPRRHLVNLDAAIRHRPDLVIEVLSPTTRDNDRGRKMQMFARYGVPEYWIADPAASCLEVHVLSDGEYELRQVACDDDPVESACLTGLSFPASAAFVVP